MSTALAEIYEQSAEPMEAEMAQNMEIDVPRHTQNDVTTSVITPMEMLQAAVRSGASIEMLEKLMALQERYEANQARRAFDEAIASAKAEISPIIRNATGHNNKKYADFAAIAETIDPVISRYGLSYRFRTQQTDRISVTCVLSHKAGHSEETTLAGPPDASGSKNAIQAIGSTLTYLQRYSLVQALGLATANDDDGKNSGRTASDFMSKEQIKDLLAAIDKTETDVVKFCRYYKIEAVAELPASKFDAAMTSIQRAYDQRSQTNG